MKHNELWLQVKSTLKSQNSGNSPLQTWLEPTQLISADEESGKSTRFVLGVPTELHKYWISQHLTSRISSEISSLYENPFEIDLRVTGQHDKVEMEKTAPVEDPSEELKREVSTSAKAPGSTSTSRKNALNQNYTFSTFVVGTNNEFAHAASYNIAKNPGADGYNPLFIYGPTGIGKTHLLNAVGNEIHSSFPKLRICYISAEQFLIECVSCIRRQEMHKFRLKYRENCDVLLMDDIQTLNRGEAVQGEFFHTLNHFFGKKQQVVVASDRMPKDINGLEDRIRTRLEWGLIADIQMPDVETRMAILKYKAEQKNLRCTNDVINYIARISKRSIRELEGNLNKIKMYSELQGLSISLELAKKVLAVHEEDITISVEEIKKICALHFGVRVVDLNSKSRTKPLVIARQTAMFLIKKYLDKSLVDIGRAFGGKDHTTVINALRRIADQQAKDIDLRKDIEELETRIHSITGL